MTKLKKRTIASAVLRRVLNPVHLGRAARLQFTRRAVTKARDDAQLRLYGDVFPGDFLHYGYFDDVDTAPEDLSLNDFINAQSRYAEVLVDLAHAPRGSAVLDVGCGMGGMSRMLLERGFAPVALTPNDLQASYITAKYPAIEVLHCKFEDLPVKAHAQRFATVFTAESLQYLNLDRALPKMADVLSSGGRWIACDYFKTATAHTDDGAGNGAGNRATNGRRTKSGHRWTHFVEQLARAGWKISYERDITANVLPTLRCVHMWGRRVGLPLVQFAVGKLRRKQPGLHYVFEDVLALLERAADDNLQIVNPDRFAADQRYMLLVMERA